MFFTFIRGFHSKVPSKFFQSNNIEVIHFDHNTLNLRIETFHLSAATQLFSVHFKQQTCYCISKSNQSQSLAINKKLIHTKKFKNITRINLLSNIYIRYIYHQEKKNDKFIVLQFITLFWSLAQDFWLPMMTTTWLCVLAHNLFIYDLGACGLYLFMWTDMWKGKLWRASKLEQRCTVLLPANSRCTLLANSIWDISYSAIAYAQT